MAVSPDRRWLALALISVVQFMVVLDIAIVNVALPSIKVDLGFSQENLQWVISAYALVFGGFLLLGGRAADLLGRRRVFVAGLVLFAAGSIVAGLAWSEASLIGARSLQGLGAAVISPAALSILMTTFGEGRERNIALGVWGAVGMFGAAAGVLLGGIFTDLLSWEWIFFINVPVAIGALALTPVLLAESRDARGQGFDALGAVLVTSGLSTSVFAITKANDYGWASAKTIGLFAVGGRASRLLRRRRAANQGPVDVVLDLQDQDRHRCERRRLHPRHGALLDVPDAHPLHATGARLLGPEDRALPTSPSPGTSIVWATVASQLVTKIGVKPVLVTGMSLLTIGMLYFTQVSVGGSYVRDLLPGFLIVAVGMSFAFVSVSIAALAGIETKEAGLASGMINTSQQIGGALGIAILSSVAVAQTGCAARAGDSVPDALTTGFHAAFWVGAAIAALGVVASAVLIRKEELAAAPAVEPEEPVQELALAA